MWRNIVYLYSCLITLLHQNVDWCARFFDVRLIAKLPRAKWSLRRRTWSCYRVSAILGWTSCRWRRRLSGQRWSQSRWLDTRNLESKIWTLTDSSWMVSFCCFRCREITFLLYGVYELCLFAYVLGVNVNVVAKKTSQRQSSFTVAMR